MRMDTGFFTKWKEMLFLLVQIVCNDYQEGGREWATKEGIRYRRAYVVLVHNMNVKVTWIHKS